ncbi:F-box protein At4g22280-like [Carica papaya]|uniref:F-box protein At4g22280-like n=1 Tax=Carica papaya TaxID=3649 RepID=UPI000B8CDF15|nr:F-box protein At4g22280-like [Carica papaya]XP_021902170.1 F-box protein At4g22280-like [Carica papaya]XP_021902171.1 F-box protein At4g22280-like [Carica papaya]
MSRKQMRHSSLQEESAKEEREDRLSSLPEDLCKHILCMLPIQDAIRTCILSKKWRYTYQSLQNLVFDSSQFTDAESRPDHFVEFIDQLLLHHDDSDIPVIKFKLWSEIARYKLKTKWIDFALKHNVEDLVIEARVAEPKGFSPCIFSSTTLKRFTFVVGFYILKRPTSVYLPSLKELRLGGVIFIDGDLTRELFSSCPMLEYVHLLNCDMFRLKVLTVSALRLKYFHIDYCRGLQTIEMNLHTPSLISLIWRGNLAQIYHIRGGPSVHYADIQVGDIYRSQTSIDVLSQTTFNLLNELCRVTVLAVDNLFLELLFYKASSPWIYANAITFHNLSNVYMSVWPSKKHIQMIVILLSRMPNVHSAHFLMLAQGHPSHASALEWNAENLETIGMPNLLEYIYVDKFVGHEIDLYLVKVFLENAKSLVKLTISTCCNDIDGKKPEIIEKLMALPRASTNVEVLLL